LITPWNFPVAIPSWKAAPALAFGNTVVLKPSSMSALLASDLAGILEEAGAPAGVFNVVFGEAQTAQSLLTHPDADAVSFTGSQATGGQIAQVAAQRGLRFQLEMGGKNPLVILADADIERAVACAVDGAYGSSGQRCTASSRFICEEAVYDEFVARMVDRLHVIRVGHALDPSSQMGPLAFEAQFEKSLSFISGACAEGGRLLSGGVAGNQEHPGWYIRPTLIADAPEHARIHSEEVFGPVATVQRVRDLDEAIRLSNATAFGLSAGIMTRSLSAARRFRDEVRAGMLMVNLATAGVDYHAPFGGMRGSSFGHREQGYAAIDFYTQVKTSYSWS
jgi:aldehyde dehydrogenase (NAD+)